MSSIHYFPRYSQKENMVTNNTMLLFKRLYNNSPDKFKSFINMVIEDPNLQLETTLKFEQQVKGQESVPDAIIEQESFKIVIETKLYGQHNMEQLRSHCRAFGKEDRQILLWINKDHIDKEYRLKIIDMINEFNDEHKTKISFAFSTFKEICTCFHENIQEYDVEMKELISDYESFCLESGLIDNSDTKMRAVLAGTTFEQNMEHNIYYAPSDRGYQNHKYLGLYKIKAIRAVGEVICSADISYSLETGQFQIMDVQTGELTGEQQETIKKVILEARENYGYHLEEGHRFFFVEQFIETEYIKPTKGGLMGQKYFDLAEIPGYERGMETAEIAGILTSEKYW